MGLSARALFGLDRLKSQHREPRQANGINSKRVLTASEASYYLGLPVAAVRRMRIGEIRLGAAIRYDLKAIDLYLDKANQLSSAGDSDSPAEAALAKFVQDSEHAAWSS